MKNNIRYIEIDFLRGIAILGMIIFHIGFLLNFLGIYPVNYEIGIFYALAKIVQTLFFSLVGISLVLSYKNSLDSYRYVYKQIKRIVIISFCAFLVSIGSFLVTPEHIVRFGILHCIALSVLLLFPLVKYRFLVLFVGIFAFQTYFVSFPSFDFLGGYIFGFSSVSYPTLDYFPIFPWIGFVAVGIFVGHYYSLYRQKKERKRIFPLFQISFIGRHALLIYMVHIPLLWGILTLFS